MTFWHFLLLRFKTYCFDSIDGKACLHACLLVVPLTYQQNKTLMICGEKFDKNFSVFAQGPPQKNVVLPGPLLTQPDIFSGNYDTVREHPMFFRLVAFYGKNGIGCIYTCAFRSLKTTHPSNFSIVGQHKNWFCGLRLDKNNCLVPVL